jgi:hypothetical protein
MGLAEAVVAVTDRLRLGSDRLGTDTLGSDTLGTDTLGTDKLRLGTDKLKLGTDTEIETDGTETEGSESDGIEIDGVARPDVLRELVGNNKRASTKHWMSWSPVVLAVMSPKQLDSSWLVNKRSPRLT